MGNEVQLNVGDYVQTFWGGKLVAGILYENDNRQGGYRMQLADGEKFKQLKALQIAPATPEQIAEYQASAIAGLTPAEIIEREHAEILALEAKGGDNGGISGEDEDNDEE